MAWDGVGLSRDEEVSWGRWSPVNPTFSHQRPSSPGTQVSVDPRVGFTSHPVAINKPETVIANTLVNRYHTYTCTQTSPSTAPFSALNSGTEESSLGFSLHWVPRLSLVTASAIGWLLFYHPAAELCMY